MKIWCVDHAGLASNFYGELFFTKEEAQNRYDSLYAGPGSHRKMYQVEDIWGWCGRNFSAVINEVVISRDNGDGYTYIYGMANEVREAARHCGVEHCSVDAFWADGNETFVLSVAWFHNGKLYHYTNSFYGLDAQYNYPTIVERRSKYEKV